MILFHSKKITTNKCSKRIKMIKLPKSMISVNALTTIFKHQERPSRQKKRLIMAIMMNAVSNMKSKSPNANLIQLSMSSLLRIMGIKHNRDLKLILIKYASRFKTRRYHVENTTTHQTSVFKMLITITAQCNFQKTDRI